jgi:hypothetical protein
MLNIIIIILCVILLCLIDVTFILFILPNIISYIHRILQGELFMSIFEFFIACFFILLLTAGIIYAFFKLF